MTDNNHKELDIAQRIVEAMQRSTIPRRSAVAQFKPDEDTVIGEVPEHLRHLHNLLIELVDEIDNAEHYSIDAMERHGALRTIFFIALEQHVPSNGDNYDGIKVCEDWSVVGYKRDNNEEMLSLDAFLTMVAMGS